MLIRRSMSVPLLATLITLSSNPAVAATSTGSNFLSPVWVISIFVIIGLIFRKELSNAYLARQQSDNTSVQKQVPPEQKASTIEIEKADKKISDEMIDLKDNSKQCQASTAKGTRCKRKTTLESAIISIENRTYSLTVCKQHNTDSLKPYAELIK